MSDSNHEMPETPWWSQPGTTAVLPTLPEEPPTPPPYDEPATEHAPSPKRRTSALLLALALVVGGGVGGGVAALVDNHSSSVSSSGSGGSTPLAGGSVSSSSGGSVSGTPESAAAIVGPSVVTIEVTGTTTSTSSGFFGQSQSQQTSDTGSGIIIRSNGYIVTNNHVVAADANGSGSVHVTLADGTTLAATIVGTDSTTDLAVIKIDKTGLPTATFAASSTLKVGESVIAVGAPLGLSNTVTEGIVSTLHRPVATGDSDSDQAVINAIQTDAAINPGNSGGALADLAGRVVGIPSAIASTGQSTDGSQSGNIGVGFAIPAETVTKVADQLISTGHATHSQIGVSVGDVASTTDGAPGLGAQITKVMAGFPAAAAGLQAGDVVTKVNSQTITDSDSLITAIRGYDPGTKVTLTFTRGGQTKTVQVTLGSATDS